MHVQKTFLGLDHILPFCGKIRTNKSSTFNGNENVYQCGCIQELQPLLHWRVCCTEGDSWMNRKKKKRSPGQKIQESLLHAASHGAEFPKAAPVLEDYALGGRKAP